MTCTGSRGNAERAVCCTAMALLVTPLATKPLATEEATSLV